MSKKNKIILDKIKGYKVIDGDDNCFVAYTGKSEKGGRMFEICLTGKVRGGSHYHELMVLLRNASQKDEINIIMNNYGGDLDGAHQLINAIRDSKAKITSIVNGGVYSAAPLIVLACPNIVLKPISFFMFHDYKTFLGGSGFEMEEAVKANRYHIEELIKYTAFPFLTKTEISYIMKGANVYIYHEEAEKRLKRHMRGRK